MARGAHGMLWAEYGVAAAMLVLALLFPIGLMVFNPTLMFERGWEQYVGTSIYLWAVLTLGRELLGLWRNERAFEDAPELLRRVKLATGRKDAGEPKAQHRRPRRFPTKSGGSSPGVSGSSSATSARRAARRSRSSWRSTAKAPAWTRSRWPAGSP